MNADNNDAPGAEPVFEDGRAKWTAYGNYIGALLSAWVVWLWRFLVGSLLGVLVLSISAYVAAPSLGLTVFSLGELIVWFSEQSEGAQVAVGGAILAALGLVGAYWTAVSAWKAQKEIELRVEAASRLQELFHVAHRYTLDARGYVSALRESVRLAAAAGTPADKAIHLRYVHADANEFEKQKQALHEARMALHGLSATHANVLTQSWYVSEKLRAAMAIIDSTANAVLKVIGPRGDLGSPSFVAQYCSQFNDQYAAEVLAACDGVTALAAPTIGFIAGRLAQQAVKPRLGGLLVLTLRSRFFAPVIYNVGRTKPPKFPK